MSSSYDTSEASSSGSTSSSKQPSSPSSKQTVHHQHNDDATMLTHTWPPRLYLAIDCGGTKAAAAICDENGKVLGRGQGGPANYTDIGLLPFLASVEEAVKGALDEVKDFYVSDLATSFEWRRPPTPTTESSVDDEVHKFSPLLPPPQIPLTIADALNTLKPSHLPHDAPSPQFEAAWLGIAGVDSASDVMTLSPHIASLLSIPYPSHRLIVANDTSLLASPIADPFRSEIKSGVVAIAGTGSIVMSFRRRRNGMLKVLGRVGGFGWLLGDEGSGYTVGRAAVREVLNLADRERLQGQANIGPVPEGDESSSSDEDESDDAEGRIRGKPIAKTSLKAQSKVRKRVNGEESPTFQMDVTAQRLSRELSISTISSLSRQQDSIGVPSPPPSARVQTYSEAAGDAGQANGRSPLYGHVLRDRILQHWGLSSTDELLRAVYFDDCPEHLQNRGAPQIKPLISVKTARESANSLSPSLSMQHNVIAPSANLLPPSASGTDGRDESSSPILSLGSSPSRTVSDASDSVESSVAPSPSFTRSNSGQRPIKMPAGASTINVDISALTGRDRSDSTVATGFTSAASSVSTSGTGGTRAKMERKHRLASLAPLVFHLAFTHHDALSLEIVRTQAKLMATQIVEILQPDRQAKAHLDAHKSVLCLGGSLVGVEGYRAMLIEQLAVLGVDFARVEFVGDAAKRGAVALSHVMERGRAQDDHGLI